MQKPGEGYTIYTKSNCTYCTELKKILKGIYFNCDEYDMDDFFDMLSELTDKNPSSFPMIFKDGAYIGGYNDYINFHSTF